MIALLLHLVTIVQPPVEQRPPAPPPPVFTPTPFIRMTTVGAQAERYVVDVEIKAGSDVLWSGSLRVASNTSSTFTRSQTEPREDQCTEESYSATQSSLNVQLTPTRRFESGVPALGVTVRWSRPVPSACKLRGAARTVELTDAVVLGAGQSAALKGDGGIIVLLRRR